VAYVVGASHVLGEDAARDVFALVGRHDPDVVLLELCAERAPAALRAAVAATRRAGPPTGPPEASPATAAPPRLAVTSVTVEGIPRDRPLPGASERDLLATLRARPNATLAPEDLDADAARLRSLGLFRDVAVEVRGADETDGERDRGGDSRDPLGSFVVSRVTGEVAELARASEVAFAVSPDPDDRATADVRFSWGRRARREWGQRDALEKEIVRTALRLLLEEDREEEDREDATASDDDEEGEMDEEDEDEEYDSYEEDDSDEEAWEGAALRAALAASARTACPGAEVSVCRVPRRDPSRDVDEGGVVWVAVSLGGEPTRPPVPAEVTEGTTRATSDDDPGERVLSAEGGSDAFGGIGGASFAGGGAFSRVASRVAELSRVASRVAELSRVASRVAELSRVASRVAELSRVASRVASAAAVAPEDAPAATRAFVAASELAQDATARALAKKTDPDDADDASASSNAASPSASASDPYPEHAHPARFAFAGGETVAALCAATRHGVPRVVFADAPASETARAIAEAAGRRPGLFPNARFAAESAFAFAASAVDAALAAARGVPESGGNANARGGEDEDERRDRLRTRVEEAGSGAGGGPGGVVPEWLEDALLTRRDDRVFAATWAALGGDKAPASAFPGLVASGRGREEGGAGDEARYDFVRDAMGAEGGAGGGGGGTRARTAIVVVGAAHVDGVAARWEAAASRRAEEAAERSGGGEGIG
jgi:hypothetical protein